MSLKQEHKDILQSIQIVKFELNSLKESGASKTLQLECFKRLVTLYGLLNAQYLIDKVEAA